ncbi:hypothetical protein BDQ17DRAFT_1254874 [Cyathus striatus]|nr:hypothetical protein BDQ17DRAFT_1254874 [Cyathus striatus]
MFRNFTRQLAAASAGNADESKKVLSPMLRPDIYSAIDKAKSWISGGIGSGQAGDGVTYGPILGLIQKHFPNITVGLDSIGQVEAEIAIVVGGVTNMVMELSNWEPMAGGMAMRTWADALVTAYNRATGQKDLIAKGITRGLNENTDVTLMTKEFTAKIQIISCLKTVSTRIYGTGSDEARRAEAVWSSKFM